MILVTGGTGLVGSQLLLQLVENRNTVSAIYRDQKSIGKTKDLFLMHKKMHLFERIVWILADVNDIPSLEAAFQGIEYVYHCAGKISFDPRDETQLRKVNIEGTANIVNFCLAKNIKKLCYVSSITSLGDLPNFDADNNKNTDQTVIDEKTEWNPEIPHTDYAISKYGAEMEVWRGFQEGLKVIIVNPGVILGAVPKTWNRHEGSFLLITNVASGMKFYANGVTGFVGVTDVALCMIQLMHSDSIGNRYILVSENMSYRTLLDLTSKHLKVNAPKIEVKKWMSNIAWRMDWIAANLFFQKRKLTRNMAKIIHEKDFYSNEKIKNQLHFTFEPIEEVIKNIAENY